MLVIFGIISAGVLIILIELPTLRKEKFSKDSFVFGLFLLIAVTLAIIMAVNLNLPTLFDWLIMVFKPLNYWVDHISLG